MMLEKMKAVDRAEARMKLLMIDSRAPIDLYPLSIGKICISCSGKNANKMSSYFTQSGSAREMMHP